MCRDKVRMIVALKFRPALNPWYHVTNLAQGADPVSR